MTGNVETKSTAAPDQRESLFQKIWQSFMSALGSIVFGMEDGTVSIFGLVFGVAASASNSQTVLLAGATGANMMSEHAVLGPVDPQLGQYPAVSLLKTVEEKSKDKLDDATLILADQTTKAITQVQTSELLGGKYPDSVSNNLADLVSQGKWTHDFPITFDFARELGLHVSSDVPPQVLELMTLHPQPVRHYTTVEYLPGRRVAEPRVEVGEPFVEA